MAVTPPYDALIAHDVDLYDVDHYMSVVCSLESMDLHIHWSFLPYRDSGRVLH